MQSNADPKGTVVNENLRNFLLLLRVYAWAVGIVAIWGSVRVTQYTITVLHSYQDAFGGVPVPVYVGVGLAAGFTISLIAGVIWDGVQIMRSL